jgi:hypothetical protein
LIAESAARKVWPGEDPIGKMQVNDPRSDRITVIGVTGGLVVGVVVVIATGKWIESFLFGVRAVNPASRANPMDALRNE